MRRTLSIAIPLSLATVLLVAFLVLLAHQAERQAPAPGEPEPVTEDAAAAPAAAPPVPVGPPEAPFEPPSRERFASRGDGLHRWNLGDLPEGWDPALAASLHNYFELMDRYEKELRRGTGGEELFAMREELREFLAGLGPEALPTLAKVLDSDSDFVYRRFLLVAIGDLGAETEEATWVLRDYFMARQEDPTNRSEVGYVIEAMGKLGNNTSYDVLTQLVQEDTVSPYREKLVMALGRHPRKEEATGFFVEGLLTDTSKKTRLRHAWALGEVRDPQTLPDLYHAFQRETYFATKEAILGTIGKIGSPNSIPFLEEQARYASEDSVRLSAAKALSRIGTPYALEVLRGIASSERQDRVREYMAKWANNG